jgi:hypothetical protein
MHRTKLILLAAALLAAYGHAQTGGEKRNAPYPVVGVSVTGASEVNEGSGAIQSKLELESSDAHLVAGFERAKRQAMAYAFDGDPVGPWYEAAEPGREAFCMRDTAHQAMGAHALGLARQNLNMLRRFAGAVSDSRDWCGFWEIDRYGRPAPVDYKDDAAFWYNLPANFDVLDACYRMYLWSGDRAYVSDAVFLNFYDRTVKDYVERWGLGLDQVMSRPRLLNMRGIFDPSSKFQAARGIPGYDEGNHEYAIGADVLATQYAAYVAYARIAAERTNADAAREYAKKAAAVRALVNSTWWDGKDQSFYGRVSQNHKLEGRGGADLLYRDIVDDGPKLKSALADSSHSLEVLYRYGDPGQAYARLLDVVTPGHSRFEYPEVPYSVIGAIVNGTMGINLESASALEASEQGFWVETAVRTLSGLAAGTDWARLRNLPVRANEITVYQEGLRKTTLTNQRGPALIWQAGFRGAHDTLLVDGRPMKARVEKATLGRENSWIRVAAGAGGTVTVEVPND